MKQLYELGIHLGPGYYKLGEDGRTPVRVTELLEWAKDLELRKERGRVGWDYDNDIGVTVSTTFLGLEHGHDSQGRPLLFETMIFGGPHDQYQERYPTWEHACGLAGLKRLLDGPE